MAAGTVMDSTYDNNNAFDVCVLESPPIDLTTAIGPVLSFLMWMDTESCCDGGNVKISTDGGTNWSLLDDTVIEPDYDGMLIGESAYRGDKSTLGWHQVTADLTAWVGQTIMLRFAFRSDGSVTRPGWFIDDVMVAD